MFYCVLTHTQHMRVLNLRTVYEHYSGFFNILHNRQSELPFKIKGLFTGEIDANTYQCFYRHINQYYHFRLSLRRIGLVNYHSGHNSIFLVVIICPHTYLIGVLCSILNESKSQKPLTTLC